MQPWCEYQIWIFRLMLFNSVFLVMFLLLKCPHVTPNAGKTSVFQETPITWWAPTVCPCWSTTSEECNSWSVPERERVDPSPVLLLRRRDLHHFMKY